MTLTPRLIYLLCVPPLMVALNAVIGRYLAGTVPPLLLNAARWTLVTLIAAPMAWRVVREPSHLLRRWRYFGVLGFLGMVCFPGLQYLALRSSSALNVTLIASSLPIGTLVIGALFYRTHPTLQQVLGALLSVAGVLLVISRGSWHALVNIHFVSGDLLMFLATLAWAAYTWLVARPPEHMRGAQAPGWNWVEFVWPQVLMSLMFMWPLAGAEQLLAPQPLQWRWQLGAAIVFLALGPSLYSYRCWSLSVTQAGPALMAFFANLAPLFAALLGSVLLGEWPAWYHGLAFVCIVLGIVVSRRQ